MPSPHRNSQAASHEPHARAREAAYANINAQMRSAPRVVRTGVHPTGGDWALDLPRDKVAAVQYLKGMERARRIELESIRKLRRSVEAENGTVSGIRRRGIFLVAILMALASGAWFWQERAAGPDVGDARVTPTDHSAHGAMGSGVAVTISDSEVDASRVSASPGSTTFILRNAGEAPSEFVVVPRARVRGPIASMSAGDLHRLAIAAKHDLAPSSREELVVELGAGEYLLFASHARGVPRTVPFNVG